MIRQQFFLPFSSTGDLSHSLFCHFLATPCLAISSQPRCPATPPVHALFPSNASLFFFSNTRGTLSFTRNMHFFPEIDCSLSLLTGSPTARYFQNHPFHLFCKRARSKFFLPSTYSREAKGAILFNRDCLFHCSSSGLDIDIDPSPPLLFRRSSSGLDIDIAPHRHLTNLFFFIFALRSWNLQKRHRSAKIQLRPRADITFSASQVSFSLISVTSPGRTRPPTINCALSMRVTLFSRNRIKFFSVLSPPPLNNLALSHR